MHIGRIPNTVHPAQMERFGAAKTVPYIQKNHLREVHLYIYILGSIAREEVFIIKLPWSYDQ